MSNTPGNIAKSAVGISPEEAQDVRARAWRFVFECYEAKKNPAAGQSGQGLSDATETKEDATYEGTKNG